MSVRRAYLPGIYLHSSGRKRNPRNEHGGTTYMIRARTKHLNSFRSNVKLARSLWGAVPVAAVNRLRELTAKYRLSLAAGDLQLIEGRWYVTHAGLLRVAERRRCTGIRTSVDRRLSDSNSNRWVFKATAYTVAGPKGFVGYGD